jgi:hypothetical protein
MRVHIDPQDLAAAVQLLPERRQPATACECV